MQNRILLIISIILTIVLIVVSSNEIHTTFFNSVPSKIIVKNTKTDEINKMNLEEYVVGVVAAEMPASFQEEALKAQAVASRTYAVYKMESSKGDYDVVTDVSNQSYITINEMKTKWQDEFDYYYEKVKDAVNATQGEVLKYNDEIVEAYYFAMSNGYTEDASLVFSEDRDYLQSVESAYDNETLKNFSVTKTFTKEDICKALNINCTNLVFSNIKRSATHRVNSITINDKEFKGTVVRSKLGLRSTDFDVTNNGDKVLITTRGYGHGVGMSQYGANGMAKDGYNYEEILQYYYKNVKISTI